MHSKSNYGHALDDDDDDDSGGDDYADDDNINIDDIDDDDILHPSSHLCLFDKHFPPLVLVLQT